MTIWLSRVQKLKNYNLDLDIDHLKLGAPASSTIWNPSSKFKFGGLAVAQIAIPGLGSRKLLKMKSDLFEAILKRKFVRFISPAPGPLAV
jgi:hypothetical protein